MDAGAVSVIGWPEAWYLVLNGVRVLAGAVAYLIMVGTPNLQQQLTDMFKQLTNMFSAS